MAKDVKKRKSGDLNTKEKTASKKSVLVKEAGLNKKRTTKKNSVPKKDDVLKGKITLNGNNLPKKSRTNKTDIKKDKRDISKKINNNKSDGIRKINTDNKNNDNENSENKIVRNKKSDLKRKDVKNNENKKKLKEAIVIVAILILMAFTYNVFGRSYIDRMERKDFIETMEPMAAEIYKDYGILPSITISQSAIESNWGQSELSKKGFNVFELKADKSWNGKTISLYTKEDNNKSVETKYRKYGSYKESLNDYVEHILKNEHYKRSALFHSKNYKAQAKVLEEYENNEDGKDKKIYESIIIETIEKYDLDEIDKKYK